MTNKLFIKNGMSILLKNLLDDKKLKKAYELSRKFYLLRNGNLLDDKFDEKEKIFRILKNELLVCPKQ